MSTFTQILYQIVFSTKNRERALSPAKRPQLFEYIWGILKEKGCHGYRINGVDDHIHIATHIHPSVALASLVKDIKLASSGFVKDHLLFRNFGGWQDGRDPNPGWGLMKILIPCRRGERRACCLLR